MDAAWNISTGTLRFRAVSSPTSDLIQVNVREVLQAAAELLITATEMRKSSAPSRQQELSAVVKYGRHQDRPLGSASHAHAALYRNSPQIPLGTMAAVSSRRSLCRWDQEEDDEVFASSPPEVTEMVEGTWK